jgi:hypothetical protein
MILDKQNELSSAQAVTAAAASTNYIDQGAARDAGNGDQLYLMVTCDVAPTAAGAATVNVKLQSDDNSSFSSPTDVAQSGALAKTAFTAGMEPIYLPIPPMTPERYLRAYFDVQTGPLTAGSFSARIVSKIQRNTAYADAL